MAYRIVTDEEAAELARRPELRREDVLRLLGEGEYERFPFAEDCDIDDTGIWAKPFDETVPRTSSAEQRARLERHRLDLELRFPCTPAQLLAWCERNRFEDLLPSPFVALAKAETPDQRPAETFAVPSREMAKNPPSALTASQFGAALRREEHGQCSLGRFFPAWAGYCQMQNTCPYEGFRTLMEWGVTVKAGKAGTLGELLAFDPADLRVAFIRARKVAKKSGDDGLSGTLVTVPDYDDEGMPLADFWLNRENLLGILAERGTTDFPWPEGEMPTYAPPAGNAVDEDSTGFLFLPTAINRLLGMADEDDGEKHPDWRAIQMEIIAERAHKTWPVRLLNRRDTFRLGGKVKAFEYVHFGELAEWAFRRNLPISETLAERFRSELSDWLLKSLRLRTIQHLRDEYRTASFSTGEGLIERDRRLAELDQEEREMTAFLEQSAQPADSAASGAGDGRRAMEITDTGAGHREINAPVVEMTPRGPEYLDLADFMDVLAEAHMPDNPADKLLWLMESGLVGISPENGWVTLDQAEAVWRDHPSRPRSTGFRVSIYDVERTYWLGGQDRFPWRNPAGQMSWFPMPGETDPKEIEGYAIFFSLESEQYPLHDFKKFRKSFSCKDVLCHHEPCDAIANEPLVWVIVELLRNGGKYGDWRHWAELPRWTGKEAACLIYAVDPFVFDGLSVKSDGETGIPAELRNRITKLSQHAERTQGEAAPLDWLEWAGERGLSDEIHPRLTALIQYFWGDSRKAGNIFVPRHMEEEKRAWEPKNQPPALETPEVAAAFAGVYWTYQQWKSNLSDCPKWLAAARVIKGRKGKSAATWNPIELAKLLLIKDIELTKVDRLFRTKTELKSWQEEWEKYENRIREYYE